MNKLLNRYKSFKQKQESGTLQSNPILIFDMMYIFKSNYTVRPLITETGTMLGGVAGTIETIIKTAYKFNSTKVICVFDGKNHHARRKKIYEGYKSNRNKNKSSFSSAFDLTPEQQKQDEEFQLKLLKHIVKWMPMKAFSVETYEADDIIAYLSNDYLPSKNKDKNGIIICTGDKDYIQLINDKVSVYNLRKHHLVNKINFSEYWDTDHVENIVHIRCVEGDNSDAIEGVSGLKIKSLVKLLPEVKTQKLPTAESFINLIEQNREFLVNSKKGKSLFDSKHIIERNYKLMKLPIAINPFVEMKLDELMQESDKKPENLSKVIKILIDYKLTDVLNPDRITRFFTHLTNI